MRKYFFTITCSVFSAILAAYLVTNIQSSKEKVVIRETPPAQYTNYNFSPSVSGRQNVLFSSPTEFTTAAEISTAAVVNIKTTASRNIFDFWNQNDIAGTSAGSGVIITQDGYIVTNNHVIEEGDKIEVTLNNNKHYIASIVGSDPSTDLALLKIEATSLPFITFGDSDSLRIGEWVLAVGNPFNLNSTVTVGIVSAKARSIEILMDRQDRIESFIQTDAVVNPGNSGGALVNTKGELVGINTAIITKSGRYEGYSFAVPINLVRKVIQDLKDFGIVQRGVLGVFTDEMTPQLAEELNLNVFEGIYINRVIPLSSAFDAGLQRGDIIISINGKRTKTRPEMQELLGRSRPGQKIRIDYIRGQSVQQIEVILKNKSNNTAIVTNNERNTLRDLGFEIRNLNSDEIKRFGFKGVKVISIFKESIISGTNMDPGFIIQSFNDKYITNIQELTHLLEKSQGKVVLKGIYENYQGEYGYSFINGY